MEPTTATPPTGSLTGRKIGAVYAPVAFSWLLMMLDTQIVTAAISRKPDADLNTAALFILLSLAVWFETPIIDLTTTATTLARNRTHYLELRRFAILLVLIVTAFHALVTFTPLYWVATEGLLGISHAMAAAARLPLMCMVLWPGCIGWRRYCQGVLIGGRQTGFIALGTVIRLTVLSLVVLGLFHFSNLPGIALGGIGMMCAVASETLFVHLSATKKIGENLFRVRPDQVFDQLGLQKILAFHFPLTLSTMVIMLANPLVVGAMARMPEPTLRIAAYQVGTGFLWLVTSYSIALPEIVITLYKDFGGAAMLRKFCIGIGLSASAIVLLLVFTGVDKVYFVNMMGATPEVAKMGHVALLASAPIPIVSAFQSYMRALLTAHHLTFSRLLATIGSTLSLGLALAWGVAFHADSILVVCVGSFIALVAELLVLVLAWKKGRDKALGLQTI